MCNIINGVGKAKTNMVICCCLQAVSYRYYQCLFIALILQFKTKTLPTKEWSMRLWIEIPLSMDWFFEPTPHVRNWVQFWQTKKSHYAPSQFKGKDKISLKESSHVFLRIIMLSIYVWKDNSEKNMHQFQNHGNIKICRPIDISLYILMHVTHNTTADKHRVMLKIELSLEQVCWIFITHSALGPCRWLKFCHHHHLLPEYHQLV